MRGRGILFLVVGPSGVGKDSLIDGARLLLSDDVDYCFPKRLITRPAAAGGEIHHAVTDREFDRLEATGALMLSWQAHGWSYGIPRAADEALAQGRSVIVNVSRQVVDEARRRWSPVRVLSVSAPRDVLKARLMARGRETVDDIERRLDRADAYKIAGDDVREVVNADRLDSAIERLIALLEQEMRTTVTMVGKETGPSG